MNKTNAPHLLKVQELGEELLFQWPRFNESHWLRSEIGVGGYDTIIEKLLSTYNGNFPINNTSDYFDRLKPGTVASSLDNYRLKNIVNINPESIQSNLSCYPLSLIKLGQNPASYTDLANQIVDASDVINTRLVDADFSYCFGPHGKIVNSYFRNVIFKHADLVKRKFINSVFDNVDFRHSIFLLDSVNNGTVFTWSGCQFNDCDFTGSYAQEISLENVLFKNSKINDCVWDKNTNHHYEGHRGVEIIDSEINNTILSLGLSENKLKFTKSTAKNSTFSNLNSANKGSISAEYTVFENSTFSHSKINATCVNNSFKKVSFNNSFEVTAAADISGSDFTDSNISTFYTKATLKATGCTYNESTLWVDGTLL